MEKVVFVKAKFLPLYKTIEKKIPTGEFEKGIFGKKEIYKTEKVSEFDGYSNCLIDGETLASDIQKTIEKLNEEGFKILSISPVESGNYNYSYKEGYISSSARAFIESDKISGTMGYGYGYGYSFTEGVIILASKI